MGRSSGGQTLASLAPTKGNTVGGEGSLFGAESVGADGEVLTANAGATRGFDWQPSAGGGGGVTVSHGFQRVPGSQSIDDDTETLIDTYDVGGSTSGTAFTLGLTRITINAAIEVAATANLRFADDSTGFRYIEILHKNVGDVVVNRRRQTSAASTVANQPTAMSVAMQFTALAGDYVEVRVYQNSGGALLAQGGVDGNTSLEVAQIPTLGANLEDENNILANQVFS